MPMGTLFSLSFLLLTFFAVVNIMHFVPVVVFHDVYEGSPVHWSHIELIAELLSTDVDRQARGNKWHLESGGEGS